jgi:hypothetical protein
MSKVKVVVGSKFWDNVFYEILGPQWIKTTSFLAAVSLKTYFEVVVERNSMEHSATMRAMADRTL